MDDDPGVSPIVADRAGLQDLIDSLREHLPTVERDIAGLRAEPADRDLIGSLFRALHTIKGDAAFCRVDLAVSIVHPLESMLERVRRDELPFTEATAEVIELTVDRLDEGLVRLVRGNGLADLMLSTLIAGLEQLAWAEPQDFAQLANQIIEKVTGRRPRAVMAALTGDSEAATREEDLRFFLALASQLESRSPQFKGRTRRLLRLATETNRLARTPIDPIQLEAAVYMHDVGMMFLPESAWLKSSVLTAAEKTVLRRHPVLAAGLLRRMTGWEDAAEMVAQHHEMPDGKGYPGALTAARICPGASLLAIVDAFESITLKHGNRGRNRSLLRAIAEINACDRQFAPEWIEPFNQVIRNSVRGR